MMENNMNFKPQKVFNFNNLSEQQLEKIKNGPGYIITEKYEGWYGYLEYINGRWGKIKSSSGRIIPALEEYNKNIKEDFSHHINYNFILIFEIYINGLKFQTLNGILNKKYKFATGVKFLLHDIYIPSVAYMAESKQHIIQQLQKENNIPGKYNNFNLIPVLDISNDIQRWKEIQNIVTNKGGEGIVCKSPNSFYSPGSRIPDLIKMKPKIELDLEVIDMYKSVGKKGNEALNLDLIRKNGVTITVLISNHANIAQFMSLNYNIIGKVACISANEEYNSGKLRYPIFEYIREDKTLDELID